jgi:hypothetical protein
MEKISLRSKFAACQQVMFIVLQLSLTGDFDIKELKLTECITRIRRMHRTTAQPVEGETNV